MRVAPILKQTQSSEKLSDKQRPEFMWLTPFLFCFVPGLVARGQIRRERPWFLSSLQSALDAKGLRGLGPCIRRTMTLAVAGCASVVSGATDPVWSGTAFADRSGPRGTTLFTTMPATSTGIVTENNYAEPGSSKAGYKNPRIWADRYHEFEVGAVGTGVALGDYDGDDRPDVFVVSKTESCRLFRNLGGWKFEDVTERAGVGDKGDAALIWKQGATFADVNNDGRLDIYVCRFGAPNLLYVSQGGGTFREEAAARGLAVNDASVMGAFCDYDRDGWLDVYVQTNLLNGTDHPNGQRDFLYRNDGDGTFTNVTERAGIRGETQGHSATWWDYDEDGWPDLYVANDFGPPDTLYRNNRDGTFTDTLNDVVPHQPYSSMGADLGDVNNDGRIDFFVADMAATSRQKDQRGMAALRVQMQDQQDDASAAPQMVRNALYLNTGTGRMLEAAYLTGLAATDWTWAVRLEDLDNDGRLDLLVTNGMHREVHNTDQIQRLMMAETAADKLRIERSSPVLNEANLAYRNLGDMQFEEIGAAWGLNEKGVSFGAAFGDLDGDGDLDLIYTNYKKGVSVLRNDSDRGHRVSFALRGVHSNRFGIGATIKIETEAGVQVRQLVLARGVLSSSEPVLSFGLGADELIKRVTVTWPSGVIQVKENLLGDRNYTLTEPRGTDGAPLPSRVSPQFSEIAASAGLAWVRREARIDEASVQPLLPMRQNRRGPAVAVGDLNGDREDDLLLGGTSVDPAQMILANRNMTFASTVAALPAEPTLLNDGPVLVFDADGDGRQDLLITRAGVSLPAGATDYQPRLFLQDEKGGWRAAAERLPALPISVGAVAAADFDQDGRLDVWMGGRVTPGAYPFSPTSALLSNRGGQFEDVTDTLAPGMREVGMATSGLWSDVDGDGWLDLLVTLEWGGVKCFHNNRGRSFEDWSERLGFSAAGRGWWNSVAAADFNGDGRTDYVVGNVGLNTPYQADPAHPAGLWAGDFKGDGGTQLIEGIYEGDRLYPRRTRRELGAVVPSVLKRFPRNDAYARAPLEDVVGGDRLAAAEHFAATEFRSGVFLSDPGGSFRFEPLPRMAQVAPIQGLVAGDFTGDGHADIYAVHNSHAPVASVGRFDGGLGQLLRGDGHGNFTPVPWTESGLVVPGDAKALAVLDFDRDGWPDFFVSRNNSATLAFRNGGVPGQNSLRVVLRGVTGNETALGARVTVQLANGARQTSEVYAGGGYASQSSADCFFGFPDSNPPESVQVRWPGGETTSHSMSPPFTTVTLSVTSP